MFSKNIVLMENHNDALSGWRKTGQKNRILVHVDSHFDFAWITDRDPHEILNAKSISDFRTLAKKNPFWNFSGRRKDELTHIGNYIYPAIKENIVREFYWVVPDSLFFSRRKVMGLKREIDEIIKFNPEEKGKLLWQGDYLVSKICNIQLTICRLKDLPRFNEDVLLDIDVDYFIDNEEAWLSPDAFIQILKEKGLKSAITTIAYSVEGGFTPIGYKFFGDYLAHLLDRCNRDDKNPPRIEPLIPLYPPLIKGEEKGDLEKGAGHPSEAWVGGFEKAVSLIIKALDSKKNKSYKEALHLLKEADACYPNYASVYFHLSDVYYEMGFKKEAYDYYQKAVSIAPSYRTLYNNRGPLLENQGKLKEAEGEYKKMLELDPDNPHFLTRLGNIYRKTKRWDEAMLNYNKALKTDPNNEEAVRNIGYIQMIRNKPDSGMEMFKKAISLKPDNPFTHSYLGLVYTKKKDYNEAMRETRRAINSGLFTHPPLRWRLVFIYFKKGLYDRMIDELRAALIVSYFDIFWRIKGWLRW